MAYFKLTIVKLFKSVADVLSGIVVNVLPGAVPALRALGRSAARLMISVHDLST